MARGSKAKYTSKQKRMAKHIEEGEKKKRGAKTAARIAWATVNKETGGAGKRVKGTASSAKSTKAAAPTKRRRAGQSQAGHPSA